MPDNTALLQSLKKTLPKVMIGGVRHYVAEGDLVLDDEHLLEYADRIAARNAADPTSKKLVGEKDANGDWIRQQPGSTLVWAVDTATFADPADRERVTSAVAAAAAAWEAVCDIHFRHDPSRDGPGVVPGADLAFVVRREPKAGSLLASAFFPHWTVDRRFVRIYPPWGTGGFDPVGVLRHELGHVLGFRHEHIRSEAPAVCWGETPGAAAPLTAYDPQSVMHYFCGEVGSKALEITPVDVDGARALYGPAAAPEAASSLDSLPYGPRELDALRRAVEEDPVAVGRKLWRIVRSRAGEPTDEDARALAESVVGGGEESFGLSDLPFLLGKEPSYDFELPKGHEHDIPGFDPAHPLDPKDWRFQEGPDARRYLSRGSILYEAGYLRLVPPRIPKADEAEALPEPSPGKPVSLGFFADFANGLAASWYVGRQIATDPELSAALHLGDVYYDGTAKEYADYLEAPLRGLLGRIPLWILAGNHDLYSGGGTFHAFLDRHRGAVQKQRGHSWRLVSEQFQIVGLDTQWEKNKRIPDGSAVWELGAKWLREGRKKGRFNILCTSAEGWDFGAKKPGKLYKDLTPLVRDEGLVDLWLWGNVHHAALYAPDPDLGPFWATCIGHGGYPYETLDERDAVTMCAPVAWAEYGTRYYRWRDPRTGAAVRPDMGNNGWCKVDLRADGTVRLRYIDWLGAPRHEAVLGRRGGEVVQVG